MLIAPTRDHLEHRYPLDLELELGTTPIELETTHKRQLLV
jgi:hypothetical protein